MSYYSYNEGYPCSCQQAPRFEVWQGNELQLELIGATAAPPEGIPFDFTSATAVFLLKDRSKDPDEQAAFTASTENGGIQITDALNGKMVAVIKGEDSEALGAQSWGCPYRDYFGQFAVKLRDERIIRSALFKVRFYQGAIQTFGN